MADISDINIGINVETGDVSRGIRMFDNMKKKIAQMQLELRKGNISNKAYNRGLSQMYQELGKVTGNTRQAQSAVMKYSRSIQEATNEQLRFTTASGKGMRRMEVLAQQAGYQVGDLAVQIQGGTNAAVALGQQGSQLLGFFGPAGALAGAGLAITTAFVAPFMKANKEIKDVNKQLDELVRLTDSVTVDFDKLADKFGDSAQAVKDLRVQLLGLQADLASSALSKGIEGLAKKFGSTYPQTILRTLPMATLIMGSPERTMKSMGLDPELLGIGFLDEFSKAISAGDPELATILFENIIDAIDSSETGMQGLSAEGKALVLQLQNMLETAIEIDHQFTKLTLGDTQRELDDFNRGMFLLQALAQANATAAADKAKKDQQYHDQFMGQNAAAMAAVKATSKEAAEFAKRQFDEAFKTRTLEYNLRFSGEATVMGQSVTASGKKMKPKQSYEELIALGMSPEQIENLFGMKAPKGKRGPKAPKDALVSLMEDLELQRELLGVEQDRASVLQALGENRSKYTQDQIQQAVNATNAIRLQTEELEKQERVADTISQSFGDAFMSIVDGTMSAKDAFRSMAADIIRELYRILVVETMVQSIKRSIFPFADGGVIQGGKQVQAYANGGVVGGPTYFPMAGGKTGLMGEAGPEAIMPLKRGKGGKLGVEASGDTGAVNIVQNFSFAANGDESVKKIIAEAAPKIANMTQQQIMDARRRGGQMRSTFG
jgi:hypothetical protein